MNPLLEVEDVSKSFRGIKALDGLSMKIRQGLVYGIIGPNGSGKTTLLNVITSVVKPDTGKVIFQGKRIDNLEPYQIYNMGITRSFQIPTLFMNMVVFENLMVPPKNQIGEKVVYSFRRSKWSRQDVQIGDQAAEVLSYLKLFDIALNKCGEVSGGQMKLVELGRAMMSEPKLVLLDEPTAGVNPVLALEIFNHIKRLRDNFGLTFMIVEHRYDMLFNNADYIFLLNEGKIASEGTPEKILQDPVLAQVYIGD
ncbi:MAG: ABC transporter ATP-binding protein [Candidatus Caldarchaeum sp.]